MGKTKTLSGHYYSLTTFYNNTEICRLSRYLGVIDNFWSCIVYTVQTKCEKGIETVLTIFFFDALFWSRLQTRKIR